MGYKWKELESHIFLHKPIHINCQFCEDTFENGFDYQKHFSTSHNEEKDYKKPETKVERVMNAFKKMCSHCGYSTYNGSGLRKHIKRVHEQENKNLICPLCAKICASEENMKNHMRSSHPTKSFKCDKCDYFTNNRDSFKNHVETHGGNRFSCHICDKKTNSSRKLKCHIQNSHIKGYKYTCEICGAKYRSINGFEGHKNLHKGIKPFECHFCGKAFTLFVNCDGHMKGLHKKEYEEYKQKKKSEKEEIKKLKFV